MKTTYGIGLMATTALVVGMIGGSFSLFSLENDAGFSTSESSHMLGHLTVVHQDADGNVKYYAQGDNFIADQGLNCAPVLLFGEAIADISGCPAGAAAVNDAICVFELVLASETPAITVTTTAASATVNNCLTVDGLAFVNPGNGTVQPTFDFVTTSTESSGGTSSITDIRYRYTGGVGANQAVASAGLFETQGDALFAANDFSGGSITLQESDTLDVTWSITLT